MKARELIKMLTKAGWKEVRQSGSHRIFKHPDKPDTLSIPDHDPKDIPFGTLRGIIKKAGLK